MSEAVQTIAQESPNAAAVAVAPDATSMTPEQIHLAVQQRLAAKACG